MVSLSTAIVRRATSEERPADVGTLASSQPPTARWCSFASVGAKDNAETLTVLGREVRITQSRQAVFLARGASSRSSTSSATTSRSRPGALAGIRDRPIVLKRFVDGAEGQPFYQKRAPENRPDVAAHRDAVVSVGPHRRGGRRRRRGRARVDRQPRLHRAASARRCARAISIIPTSCASISIPGPASRGTTCVASRWRSKALLERAGAARLAEDERLARHARQRAHRAALDVHRSAARGAGVLARDRAARADARDVEVVEGGAPRRVPRLQPEREGSHDVLGVFGAAAARRARVGAARAGRRSRTAIRRTSPC